MVSFFIIFSPFVFAESVGSSEHVQAEIFSEVNSIKPGQPFTVAVRLTMEEGWHTYWQYPGDAGLATRIRWQLPAGFKVGDIEWPYPKRIEIPPLVNFGYEGEVVLLTEVMPPDSAQPDTIIEISGTAEWLECKEICIPGQAELTLSLSVKNETPAADPAYAELFSQTRDRLPFQPTDWVLSAVRKGGKIALTGRIPPSFSKNVSGLSFFPLDEAVIDIAAPQSTLRTGEGFMLFLKESPLATEPAQSLRGILMSTMGWDEEGKRKSLSINLPIEVASASTNWGAELEKVAPSTPESMADTEAFFETPNQIPSELPAAPTARPDFSPIVTRTDRSDISLWAAILFSFLGGMLLNLMPCVLPVLSVKILGFVQQAGESAARIRRHGLIFSLGILVSFWALALALLALRAGGAQLGWGFQLQSPIFVAGMAALFLLLGLNLFGVLEIGNSLMGWGGSLALPTGSGGTFMSGVLATVVATPCTAPFMGAALGFGLTQPVWISMLVFSSLGLGMALPYLILSSNPALLRFIPKPGVWMVLLKKIMAIPMMATVVWLLWVLSAQVGKIGTFYTSAALVVIGLGAWVLGKWAAPAESESTRYRANLLGAFLIVCGLAWAFSAVKLAETSIPARAQSLDSKPSSSEDILWETFSPERLNELLREGKPVFIDFTAAWCLTCQVNERLTLRSPEVRRKFRELKITALKADWTRRDEVITKALAGYGRSGVPAYVLYGIKPGNVPEVLPEVITPKIVLEALEQKKSSK